MWSAVFGSDLLLLVKASSSSSVEMAHGNHSTPLLLSVEIISQHYLIWAGFNWVQPLALHATALADTPNGLWPLAELSGLERFFHRLKGFILIKM